MKMGYIYRFGTWHLPQHLVCGGVKIWETATSMPVLFLCIEIELGCVQIYGMNWE